MERQPSRLLPARLRRLVARPAPLPSAPVARGESCQLCAQSLPRSHAHVFDLDARQPFCVCSACGVLFDRAPAGPRRYRRIGERRQRLDSLAMDDTSWRALGVPVDLAFFVPDASGSVRVLYPGPLGAIDAVADPAAWAALVGANPVLAGCAPEVECLLVQRAADGGQHWIVGVDVAYALVAVIRRHWKGFAGGEVVRAEIQRFFDRLSRGESPF